MILLAISRNPTYPMWRPQHAARRKHEHKHNRFSKRLHAGTDRPAETRAQGEACEEVSPRLQDREIRMNGLGPVSSQITCVKLSTGVNSPACPFARSLFNLVVNSNPHRC